MAECKICNMFIKPFMAPGHHIPIEWPETFRIDHPECGILFARNHEMELFAKASAFEDAGGQWVLVDPWARIV